VAAALSAACVALVINDMRALRAAKIEQLSALTAVLGANAAATLEFNDPRTARELLASLQCQPSVESAALYDAAGNLFSSYQAGSAGQTSLPVKPPQQAVNFALGGLEITQVVVHDRKQIGTIYVRGGTDDVRRQISRHLVIAAVVALLAMVLAGVLADRLQRLLTTPILRLTAALEQVAHDDYSVRVAKDGGDELGVLADGFNSMVRQIQTTCDTLQQARNELENRVQQRTAELRQALEAAEAANRAKSQFLANMSHEIRTPMTAILGCADILMERGVTTDERRENVDTIRRNGAHLLSVINDILDISKIEAGKMCVVRTDCSPGMLVAEVVSLMRTRAKDKKLSLTVDYAGPVPEKICTDPLRLRQILLNLVGNAVKFTEEGGVRLVVRTPETPSPERGGAIFEIIDTGVGMTPEKITTLFQPFSQADDSMSRRYGGTGLGLAISKRFADMLGGSIRVESAPGKGSTFALMIETGPLAGVRMLEHRSEAFSALPADHLPETTAPRLDCRILLVEDGPDNQRLIAHLLRKAGAEISLASNGKEGMEEGLATLPAWSRQGEEPKKPYDVILMDMQMPVMDGYQATRRLREAGYRAPIIALTP
jgi:signal transduction histidine kinase